MQFNEVTYRAVSIRVVVRDVDSEFKNPVLVQSMSDEYDTKPHWKRIGALSHLKPINQSVLFREHVKQESTVFGPYSRLICRKAGHKCLGVSA